MSAKEIERETATTLLQKESNINTASKRQPCTKRKVVCVVSIVVVAVLIISLVFVLIVCFADFTFSLRNYITEKTGIKFPEYQPPDTLESLSIMNKTELAEVECSEGNCSNSNTTEDLKRKTENLALAKSTWNTVWEIMHDEDGWKLKKGSSLKTGRVFSKNYRGLGTVTKFEAYVDCKPEELFKILVVDTELKPDWTPFEESQIVEKISDNTDIVYEKMKAVAGGLISNRDYVNLRHWKDKDNITLTSIRATTHPDWPPVDGIVRATNGPGGWMVHPNSGETNKCLLTWAMNPNFGGWIPQWMADQAVAGAMMKMVESVRKRVAFLRDQN